MNGLRRLDVGGLLFGLVLLAVGGYFILRNTLGFDIPDLNWDMVWPLLVVCLGGAVLWSALTRGTGGEQP
jgi:uncharacterized integral membrane protein